MERSRNSEGVMFGDYFGQRADYSHGLFYGGHRRYLNSNGMSSLEPPHEFKSKRQLNMLRLSREGTSRGDERMYQVNFQKKSELEEADPHKKIKKVVAYVRDTLIFEHYSSTRREDWTEERQAGVLYWVNKKTGEVAPHRPWLKSGEFERRSQDEQDPESKDEEEPQGTGALVYDGTELQDLFSLLGKAE